MNKGIEMNHAIKFFLYMIIVTQFCLMHGSADDKLRQLRERQKREREQRIREAIDPVERENLARAIAKREKEEKEREQKAIQKREEERKKEIEQKEAQKKTNQFSSEIFVNVTNKLGIIIHAQIESEGGKDQSAWVEIKPGETQAIPISSNYNLGRIIYGTPGGESRPGGWIQIEKLSGKENINISLDWVEPGKKSKAIILGKQSVGEYENLKLFYQSIVDLLSNRLNERPEFLVATLRNIVQRLTQWMKENGREILQFQDEQGKKIVDIARVEYRKRSFSAAWQEWEDLFKILGDTSMVLMVQNKRHEAKRINPFWGATCDCSKCNCDSLRGLIYSNECTYCNLQGANFEGVKINGKIGGNDFDFTGANLSGASFRNAVIIDSFWAHRGHHRN